MALFTAVPIAPEDLSALLQGGGNLFQKSDGALSGEYPIVAGHFPDFGYGFPDPFNSRLRPPAESMPPEVRLELPFVRGAIDFLIHHPTHGSQYGGYPRSVLPEQILSAFSSSTCSFILPSSV